jgi:hypothetical protein
MIAIDTEIVQENHHLKTSLIAKTTSHINMQGKFQFSPLDGAHYANLSSSLNQNTQKNNAKYNNKMNIRHTLIIKWRRIQTNHVKNVIIFNFTYETEQRHTSTHGSDAIRAANGKDARSFLDAIIPI